MEARATEADVFVGGTEEDITEGPGAQTVIPASRLKLSNSRQFLVRANSIRTPSYVTSDFLASLSVGFLLSHCFLKRNFYLFKGVQDHEWKTQNV